MSDFNLIHVIHLLEKVNAMGIAVIFTNGELEVRIPKNTKIDAALLQQLKDNREMLIAYFRSLHTTTAEDDAIPPYKRTELDRIPLSFAQERLFFIDRLQGSIEYNMPWTFRIKGDLDTVVLENSFRTIVNRHEVLRTVIREENGIGYQVINAADVWTMLRLSEKEILDAGMSLQGQIQQFVSTPFDLSSDPMLKVLLIRVSETEHVMVVLLHHIVFDGWSISIMVKELVELYEAGAGNRKPALKDLPVQYADFALWQRKHYSDPGIQNQVNYWKEQLKDLRVSELPVDFIRREQHKTAGEAFRQIGKPLRDKLAGLCIKEEVTLFMLLLSAFKLLLYRHTGQDDNCIGSPVAGRQHKEVEDLIGFFVNTIVLRTKVDDTKPFNVFLQEVKKITLDAYENQDVPFEKMVEVLGVDRSMDRNPLFNITFALQNTPAGKALDLGPVTLARESSGPGASKFDMSLDITESPAGLDINVTYRADLFEKESIRLFLEHYECILESIVADAARPMVLINYISLQEKKQLLDWGGLHHPLKPLNDSIVSLFREVVKLHPHHVAIVYEEETLTYKQLNDRSNEVANFLCSRGSQEGAIVGVCLPRSPELIVSILGILKSGAAYLPLDPDYPGERIASMLKNSGAAIVLTNQSTAAGLPACGCEWVFPASGAALINAEPEMPLHHISPSQPAYLMYTSGSTGEPKGVLVNHKNIVSLVREVNYIPLSADDVLLSTGSPSFDASTFEYWGMLLNGGKLVLCSYSVLMAPSQLKQVITANAVTVMWFTAGWFNELVEADINLFAGLKTIIAGGDRLSHKHVRLLQDHYSEINIINGYGPTENTTFSLTYNIKEKEEREIPIGRPLEGRSAFVLDAQKQLCGIGVAGELYVGGSGLSQGYWNRAQLTAERYVEVKGLGRLYRTGDRCRWLSDGNIEFLGRIDEQVKIRGYRVEPGEVEAVLLNAPLVKQGVIVVRQDPSGNKQLVAYVAGEQGFDREAVLRFLRDRLPDYMIPVALMQLAAIPLTANGKVDKSQLPPVEAAAKKNSYTAPRNKTETLLVQIWQELLGVAQVSINDNFFELGGHSLMAMRMVAAVKNNTGKDMAVRQLFHHPTVAALAEVLDGIDITSQATLVARSHKTDHLPLSYSQERLWFIDRLQGSVQYHMPWVFNISGELDTAALEASFRMIVERHEVLRTVIREEQGVGYQQILTPGQWNMRVIDTITILVLGETVNEYIYNQITQPFDLSAELPLRIALIRESTQKHILVAVAHHIAFDGWSISILVQELIELYQSIREGRSTVLKPLKVQYADYALWQREQLTAGVLEEKLGYWKKLLQDVTPLELPADYPRPSVQSIEGAIATRMICKELKEELIKLSQQQGTTLFMTLLAAFKILLSRYSAQKDICIGTVVAGRPHNALEGLVGFFVNLLPLRSTINDTDPFSKYLQQVKELVLQVFEHQDTPFEKIVETLGGAGDISRTPVAQIVFTVRNAPESPDLDFGTALFTEEPAGKIMSKFDVNFEVQESAAGLQLIATYCKDLYRAETMEAMLEQFEYLVSCIAHNSNTAISSLSLLSPEKGLELIDKFNNTFTLQHHPLNQPVTCLFRQQVMRTPNEPALRYGNQELSFGELDVKCNKLASYLRSRGVATGEPVIVCMERSLDTVVAILGILYAGAAYVPVDVHQPATRITGIIEDTCARFAIADTSTQAHIVPGVETIDLHRDWSNIRVATLMNEPFPVRPQHLAYVIYTSGSTGQPKGVMIAHGQLSNYLNNSLKLYSTDQKIGSGSYHHLAVGFDASVTSLFVPLLNGKCVVLASASSPNVFEDEAFLRYAPYDFLKLTPSHLPLLASMPWAGRINELIKKLVVGGEALHPAHLQFWKENKIEIEVYNEYGPTETTVGCCMYQFPVQSEAIAGRNGISIGKPMNNVRLYIVDEQANPLPVAVAGELWIAGVQVAQGYWKRPELTAEKFIADPYSKETGARVYRSGDRCRWLADGNIEFLGRMDEQVKVRGYRIEPGEIEHALSRSEGIAAAKVLVNDANELNAYLLIDAQVSIDPQQLIEQVAVECRSNLPAYMIPHALILVDHFPLTTNGKLDKKALLKQQSLHQGADTVYIAPSNPTQQSLAGIWEELLEITGVSITANFFELGGHSLLAVRLIAAVRSRMGKELTIKQVFDHPTIAGMALLLSATTEDVKIPAIVPANKTERIPLSYSQERLWFIDRLQGSVQYHMPWVFRLQGELDIPALENAFRTIIERHTILRTVIREEDGTAYQVVNAAEGWTMKVIEETAIINTNGSLENYIQQQIQLPFDLATDMMLRVELIKMSGNEYTLLAVVHHIAFDGWSIKLVIEELRELYRNAKNGRPPKLKTLPVQYADYAIWQRNHLSEGRLKVTLDYWRQQLKNIVPLSLPVDGVRGRVPVSRGSAVDKMIGIDLLNRATALSRQEGVSLFMFLLTIFKILLYRYSGQSDICIGTATAGRSQQETEGLVGFFINMLPLRSQVEGHLSVRQLLHQVRQTTLDAFKYQDAPFEKIVEAAGVPRDMSRNPVFQVLLVLQNTPESDSFALDGITSAGMPLPSSASLFDIDLSITETTEGLYLHALFCSELYTEGTLSKMLGHFENLMQEALSNIDKSVEALVMLKKDEAQILLEEFNINREEYPQHNTIITLFEHQAAKAPLATALVFGSKSLSYTELDKRATLMANFLIGKGVKSEVLVAICMEKGLELIVAIFGVLKAGGAFLPVDPQYPSARIEYMVSDSRCSLVITDQFCKDIAGRLPASVDVLYINDLEEMFSWEPACKMNTRLQPENLCYVIYTSGSTGNPKGVMIEHRGMVNLVHNQVAPLSLRTGITVLQFASQGFDAFCHELFTTLLHGGKLILVERSQLLDPDSFCRLISEHEVELVTLPATFQSVVWDKLPPGITVISAGEPLHADLATRMQQKGIRVINAYGPTENTVSSILSIAPLLNNGLVTIGKPLANVQAYILDNSLQPVTTGIAGELYLGGAQLARGYINQPALTAERFIKHPFSAAEARLYRTGDRCRWLADGNIEFLGRCDEQVKIRGYRIEPGEIEQVLRTSAGIKQAAVIAREDHQGSKYLAAFVVATPEMNKTLVRSLLHTQLPEYMLPASLTVITEMPLNEHGKVDKRRLPATEETWASSHFHTLPSCEPEQVLADIWQDLLNAKNISIHDSFFELGGDSIITIQVVSRARLAGYELYPKDIFIHQTIARIAAVAAKRKERPALWAGEQGLLSGDFGLLPVQQWYFALLAPSPSQFNQSVLLQLNRNVSNELLLQIVNVLTRQHDVLRLRFFQTPDGWRQEYGPIPLTQFFDSDLREQNNETLHAAIGACCDHWQQSLDIEKGDLLRVVRLQLPESCEYDRLLIIIHHLAVDGVSWRIILEDLHELLEAGMQEQELKPGLKGASYRQWEQALQQYSVRERVQAQLPYWEKVTGSYRPLPFNGQQPASIKRAEMNSCNEKLGIELTRRLLQELPPVYRTEINDILLSALVLTINEWTGENLLVLGLEGHGREDLGGDIDISRTVGWFTNLYPVSIEMPTIKEAAVVIRSVKEQLRTIPDKGIGYGVLKYFRKEKALQGRQPWDIVFNYLGQLDNVVRTGNRWFHGATEARGAEQAEDFEFPERLIINSIVLEGELIIHWSFSHRQFDEQTIAALAKRYIEVLGQLIEEGLEQAQSAVVDTPSDYGLTGEVSNQELERFLNEQADDMSDIMNF